MFGPSPDEPVDVNKMPDKQVINPDSPSNANEDTHRRHATLMTTLRDEREIGRASCRERV